MALTNTGALFKLMAGRPGQYYLLVGKVKGRTAYEGVVLRWDELQRWVERWQKNTKPRFAIFRLVPVAKYVRKRGGRRDYTVKKYRGGAWL